MTSEPIPAQRDVQRHNQISIRLHYQWGGEWHRMEAQQWNARGFCFFHVHALPEGVTAFKRSLQHFEGEVVWSRSSHDAAQVEDMLLNEAIHLQAQRAHNQPELQQRLVRLTRVQGMVEAKQRVLHSMGAMPDARVWAQRVALRQQDALLQSGVRVDAQAWRDVVAEALTLGGVVQDLERWSGSLGGR